MTKVLLITNKSDITSDFIIKRLHERKIRFYRFNTDELTKSVFVSININTSSYTLKDVNLNVEVNLSEFTTIYFRRPELPDIEIQESSIAEQNFVRSEIAFLLEGIYKILRKAYWISDVQAIREAENKIYQLEVAKALGFSIPKSLISNSYETSKEFYSQQEKCIVKPIKTGLIDDPAGEKLIFTSSLSNFPEELKQIESCPHFFQNEIIKKADLRLTMVGDVPFCAMIHSQEDDDTKTDWRKGEMILKHSKHIMPDEIVKKCVALLKKLNLRFGAIDFILDNNSEYHFLEINPNGQWAWIEKQTGFDISNQLVNLMSDENFQ